MHQKLQIRRRPRFAAPHLRFTQYPLHLPTTTSLFNIYYAPKTLAHPSNSVLAAQPYPEPAQSDDPRLRDLTVRYREVQDCETGIGPGD